MGSSDSGSPADPVSHDSGQDENTAPAAATDTAASDTVSSPTPPADPVPDFPTPVTPKAAFLRSMKTILVLGVLVALGLYLFGWLDGKVYAARTALEIVQFGAAVLGIHGVVILVWRFLEIPNCPSCERAGEAHRMSLIDFRGSGFSGAHTRFYRCGHCGEEYVWEKADHDDSWHVTERLVSDYDLDPAWDESACYVTFGGSVAGFGILFFLSTSILQFLQDIG